MIPHQSSQPQTDLGVAAVVVLRLRPSSISTHGSRLIQTRHLRVASTMAAEYLPSPQFSLPSPLSDRWRISDERWRGRQIDARRLQILRRRRCCAVCCLNPPISVPTLFSSIRNPNRASTPQSIHLFSSDLSAGNDDNNNDRLWNFPSDSFRRRDSSSAGFFSGEGVKSGGGDGDWLGSQWLREKESPPSFSFVADGSSGSSGSQVDDEFEEGKEEELSPEAKKLLLEEQKQLMPVLQGPNRTFGDLIAASGITDDMLDSLIALRDFEGIEGLPPLSEIEDMRYEKNTKKSTRGEIERQKQEEIAKGRVRRVDEKGRAYATGRRKCSVARVWIQPGEGQFVVNDKQFDVYFPMLDHRATLLRPFSETKTLGLWDINCTVKGGGVSAGFLTRDPRVVERKKPGKAKARKSFQWVKR